MLSVFATHLLGWGVGSRLRPVCMELACSPHASEVSTLCPKARVVGRLAYLNCMHACVCAHNCALQCVGSLSRASPTLCFESPGIGSSGTKDGWMDFGTVSTLAVTLPSIPFH